MNGDSEARCLERLRAELSRRGVRSQVITSASKPRLHIHLPGPHGGADAQFEDNLTAAAGPDGRWSLFWPWLEQIGTTGDPAHAAAIIMITLGLADSGHEEHSDLPGDDGPLGHLCRARTSRRHHQRAGHRRHRLGRLRHQINRTRTR